MPIPRPLWERILAFLRGGATGQIVLDVHRGRVQAVSLNERIRDDQATPIETPLVPPLSAR